MRLTVLTLCFLIASIKFTDPTMLCLHSPTCQTFNMCNSEGPIRLESSDLKFGVLHISQGNWKNKEFNDTNTFEITA